MLDIAFICTIFGVFILTSFKLGYKYGNSKQDNIDVAEVKKEKIIKKAKKKEEDEEVRKLNSFYTAINNLENYNGTSEGQEVIK